jgi:hypothetical protein
MAYKNTEDLATDFLIRWSISHGTPKVRETSSSALNQRVPGVRWLRYFLEVIPFTHLIGFRHFIVREVFDILHRPSKSGVSHGDICG